MGFVFSKVFAKLWGSKEHRILILGLDNAGKTTILCNNPSFHFLIYEDKLHLNEVVQTAPSKLFSLLTRNS